MAPSQCVGNPLETRPQHKADVLQCKSRRMLFSFRASLQSNSDHSGSAAEFFPPSWASALVHGYLCRGS
ncbi:hypothetical protein K523DRAFT_323883 [Schizophyllum commune Tattone D]|nr:hypothetical protein K523DRAFT_323883 [Schizophyllum commune Tattone D]